MDRPAVERDPRIGYGDGGGKAFGRPAREAGRSDPGLDPEGRPGVALVAWPRPAGPASRRIAALVRRPEVAERLSRLALQAVLAAVLLLFGLVLRLLPVGAEIRAALGWPWIRDYSVTDGRQALAGWAAAQGGWRPALARLSHDLRDRARERLGPLIAATRSPSPRGPSPASGPPASQAPTSLAPGGSAPAAPGPTSPAPSGSAPAPRAPGAAPGAPGSSGAAGGGAAPAPATPDPSRTEGPGLITFHRPAEVPAARTVRPVPGRVLADYGWVAAGEEGEHYHHGVDLSAREGEPVRALRAGTVRRVGSGDPDRREGGRNLGQFVEIDHGGGVLSRYAPLTDLKVKVGDRVEAGAVIGQVAPPPPAEPGAPHLHLEVHASGGSVDPKPFLEEGGGI